MSKLLIETYINQEFDASNSPLVWTKNGLISSSGSFDLKSFILDFYKSKAIEIIINSKLASLNLKIKHELKKLEVLTIESLNLQKKVSFLEGKLQILKDQYNVYMDQLDTLLNKFYDIFESKATINTSDLVFKERNYVSSLDTLNYLNIRYKDTQINETELDSFNLDLTTKNLSQTNLINTLLDNISSYDTNLSDISLQLNSISSLALTVDSNLKACVYLKSNIDLSLKSLGEKREQSDKRTKDYLKLIDEIESFYNEFYPRLKELEGFLANFNSTYEEADCFFRRKEEELRLIHEACTQSSANLQEYYDLFIGSNYIREGDNVQLNRTGCTVIVNAYLPELPPCPKPDLIPPKGGNVSVKQGPLPDCPPAECKESHSDFNALVQKQNLNKIRKKENQNLEVLRLPTIFGSTIESNGTQISIYTYKFNWKGYINLNYNTKKLKDKFEIYIDDRIVSSTNGYVKGIGRLEFFYPGGLLKILVTGLTEDGTDWSYSLNI